MPSNLLIVLSKWIIGATCRLCDTNSTRGGEKAPDWASLTPGPPVDAKLYGLVLCCILKTAWPYLHFPFFRFYRAAQLPSSELGGLIGANIIGYHLSYILYIFFSHSQTQVVSDTHSSIMYSLRETSVGRSNEYYLLLLHHYTRY